jgi:MoaA/NifB/PqqE/SkfB family radical SAM enzyme
MTVMQSNLQDLNKVIKICEEYNITKLYLFTLMPTARGEKIYEKEYVAPEIIEVMIARENEKDEKCVIKIINWNIEGQCVLIYENGDIVAQPSYKDVGNKKIVGNLFKESAKKIWEKYPFRQSHIDYYLDYH